jgi:hypothetical protein
VTRRLPDEKAAEYARLKLFLELWHTLVCPESLASLGDARVLPHNVLTEAEKTTSKSRLLIGVRQAVNDTLEDAEDFDAPRISRADALLEQRGAPTLTSLLVGRRKSLHKVLRRGAIRNDTEFHLVNAALVEMANPNKAAERDTLSTLVAEYEARLRKGNRD